VDVNGEVEHEAGAEQPFTGQAPRPGEQTEVPSARTSKAARGAEAARCPECGTRQVGDDRYCEGCGFDFVNAAGRAVERPPPSERWEAIVVADRAHFERGEWQGVDFPGLFAALTIPLGSAELRVGRGELDGRWPELDLEDPAVSRFHALLVRQEDGSYAIVDQGSTNGTTMNDDATPLSPTVPTPLKDGDRVHLGAWTTITLRRIGVRE